MCNVSSGGCGACGSRLKCLGLSEDTRYGMGGAVRLDDSGIGGEEKVVMRFGVEM